MSDCTTNHTVTNILLIEDDDVAAESVVRSLRKYDTKFAITLAQDGCEALAILANKNPQNSLQKPYIIFLDLNMPRMNGFEFLEKIRADEALKRSIIFVLTTSDSEVDRARAYSYNIAGYMVKSVVGPQFSKLAQLLPLYIAAVRLPE
jgi:CheY-like chemotaxis protein